MVVVGSVSLCDGVCMCVCAPCFCGNDHLAFTGSDIISPRNFVSDSSNCNALVLKHTVTLGVTQLV